MSERSVRSGANMVQSRHCTDGGRLQGRLSILSAGTRMDTADRSPGTGKTHLDGFGKDEVFARHQIRDFPFTARTCCNEANKLFENNRTSGIISSMSMYETAAPLTDNDY